MQWQLSYGVYISYIPRNSDLLLTLLLFKLVLCQEDRPHQLSNWRLNWHEEFPGVSTENEKDNTNSGIIIVFLGGQRNFWIYINNVLSVSSVLYTGHKTSMINYHNQPADTGRANKPNTECNFKTQHINEQ